MRAGGWGALSQPWGRLLRNYTKFGIHSCFLEEAFTARASPSRPPASHGVIQGFDFAFMKLGAFCSPPAHRNIPHPAAGAAALGSLWLERERAAGLVLSLRRAARWKWPCSFFPCLPRSPAARFPSGLLERAVRIYTLKAGRQASAAG